MSSPDTPESAQDYCAGGGGHRRRGRLRVAVEEMPGGDVVPSPSAAWGLPGHRSSPRGFDKLWQMSSAGSDRSPNVTGHPLR